MAQYQLHVGLKPGVKAQDAFTRYDELVFIMKECDLRPVSIGVFHTRFDVHMEKGAHLQMFMLSLQRLSKYLIDNDKKDTFKYKDNFTFSIARVNDYSIADRIIWG